ncbi:hypothetical protein C8A03DRAFT_18964 [Achaetomium macrosporum]|uniref:Uncharacterized protein n=1 Tax=Achaetomium macrosporum TaxID=79813 RepID=A0AAN7C2Y8_9PEZI|nr:hypothetical protein C8A03DRAFT_18964 [Achaetomium macrosporum]
MDVLSVLSPFRNFDENNAEQSKLHQLCSEWFVRHIGDRVQESAARSESLLSRLGVADISTICRSLQSLLTVVSDAPDTSINTVLHLWGSGLSSLLTSPSSANHSTITSEGEQNNALVAQATFLFLGCLSMIYEPKLFPAEGKLEIVLPRSAQISPRFRRQRQVPTDSLDISSASYLAFPHLFASFGQRLPEMSNDPTPAPDSIQGRQAGVLVASNVFYSNLYRIGRINIQWVNDIVHHLEFDERNRTLSLFAFPTYCSLTCLSEPASTLPLNRLLEHAVSFDPEDARDTIRDLHRPFDDYCREILISFGIIFAQERRSRRQVSKQAADGDWAAALGNDAIMRGLCTERWQEHLLFNYLESPPVRSNYSAHVDFPFLGPRLLQLQAYMEAQSPNDFMTLIFDRRDPLRFWTFVLAIGLGSASLLLSLVQVATSAAQLGVN